MTQNSIVWKFIENARGQWSWHRLTVNGHAVHTCSGFTGIAKCIVDAIDHGFKPNSEAYSTNSRSFDFVYKPKLTRKRAAVKRRDMTS